MLEKLDLLDLNQTWTVYDSIILNNILKLYEPVEGYSKVLEIFEQKIRLPLLTQCLLAF